MNCRLCDSARSRRIFRDGLRSYFRCGTCGLVFVPASDHITVAAEKERYNLHDNTEADPGYVRFLGEMAAIVGRECRTACRVLDFGCGKNAVLTGILRKKGFDCTPYDPLYGIGNEALSGTYDAVVICEVLEHLRDLRQELANLRKIVGPQGRIFVRTRRYPPVREFKSWWYRSDLTHINFFCRKTLKVCAALAGKGDVAFEGQDIAIFS